jgi:hypothetical protein
MDGLQVLQHQRPALVGVSAEVVLTVERMRQAVALLARPHEQSVERVERLRVILEAAEELSESMAVDRVKNIRRAPGILVLEQPLMVPSVVSKSWAASAASPNFR